ncbi:MAG: DUF5654 family protein [bacterium]|nr:DUF5654 family protein [bacterium]
MSEISKIKEESKKLQKEVRSKSIGYILTALGLVVGLAWNDAITTVIKHYFPGGAETIFAKLAYAALITIVVVVVSMYVTRLTKNEE